MHRLQERRPLAPLSAGVATQRRRRRLLTVAAVAALVVALDQVTKSLAVADLEKGPVHLLGPVSLALAYNDGIAFSLATGFTLPIIVIVVVLVGLLVFFARGAPSYLVATAIGMILGGALGNLADRLFRGHGGAVVDFVHTSFWPTFNLADAAIVIGCVLLGLSVLLERGEPRPRRSDLNRLGGREGADENDTGTR